MARDENLCPGHLQVECVLFGFTLDLDGFGSFCQSLLGGFPWGRHRIDGSKNEWGWSKSKVGANAILAVSMAVCRAGAAASGMPLYQYIVPWRVRLGTRVVSEMDTRVYDTNA